MPSLRNTAREIPGKADVRQEDQLCHLLHNLQDQGQLQEAHEECHSSAGTWTCWALVFETFLKLGKYSVNLIATKIRYFH